MCNHIIDYEQVEQLMIGCCLDCTSCEVRLSVDLTGKKEKALYLEWAWTRADSTTVHHFGTGLTYHELGRVPLEYNHPLPRIGKETVDTYINNLLDYAKHYINKGVL